ncbi:hypothetical protein KJ910_02810, partial [Patescibacteria group bacterium]|nr:hypothetical protein [Patescibacteria group bacterium]
MFDNNDLLKEMTNVHTFSVTELAVRLMFSPHFPEQPMCSPPVVSRIWQNESLVVTAKICDMNPDLDCWMQSLFSVNLGPALRLIEHHDSKHHYLEDICQSILRAINLTAEIHDWPLMAAPKFSRGSLKDGGHELKLAVTLYWSDRHVHPGNVFGHIEQMTQLVRDR